MTRNRPQLQPSREFIAVERLLCAARSPRRHRERLNVLRLALMGERSLIRLAEAGGMTRGSVAGCLAAWRNGGFAKLLDSSAIARLPRHVVEAFRDGITLHRWQSVTETRAWFLKTFDINVPLRALRYWMIVETAGASFFAPAPIATDLSIDAPTRRISLSGQRTLTTALPVNRRERLGAIPLTLG
ncbi:MAG: helix-turn-helix domain-containing protein [Verrucomicrobium sp.]|nr:helix-turn-helix domain-containing protein [Verrucomicrobium sp.]